MLVPQACPELVSFVESERVGFRIWWPLIFCPLKLLWCTGRYNHRPLPIWRPFYWTRGAADPLRTNKEISIFFLPSLCREVNKSCDVALNSVDIRIGVWGKWKPLNLIFLMTFVEKNSWNVRGFLVYKGIKFWTSITNKVRFWCVSRQKIFIILCEFSVFSPTSEKPQNPR